jgi:hypothetical protein
MAMSLAPLLALRVVVQSLPGWGSPRWGKTGAFLEKQAQLIEIQTAHLKAGSACLDTRVLRPAAYSSQVTTPVVMSCIAVAIVNFRAAINSCKTVLRESNSAAASFAF